jgi:hypothetical protein
MVAEIPVELSDEGNDEYGCLILMSNDWPGVTASGAITVDVSVWSASVFAESDPPFARQMTSVADVVVVVLGVNGPLDAAATPSSAGAAKVNAAIKNVPIASASARVGAEWRPAMKPPKVGNYPGETLAGADP